MLLKNRNEINDKFKWDLSSIISSEAEWETLFKQVETSLKDISAFKDKLDSKENILKCLVKENQSSEKLSRLYVYSRMKLDEDVKVDKYKVMANRAENLSIKFSTIASFIIPQLTALEESFLINIASDKEFKDFDNLLNEIIRNKPHILTANEEEILAQVGSFSDAFHDAFNMLDNADIKFENIEDSDGNTIEMSHGTYSVLLQNKDRTLREKAYKSMFNAFKNNINTISSLYNGNVKQDIFYAKVRKHKSAVDYAMFKENVNKTVYENLINAVETALPTLSKYLEYRKNTLGVDTLKMYDMHLSIVNDIDYSTEYQDAYQLVKTALLPLGDEYANLLERAFNEGWIDVYENKGKRSGAYSWGSYNAHPYVLLNYHKTLHDIFTIAHELGHAMHSFYSNKTQPYAKAGYEIFVAEVASTVNEVLLLKHFLKTAKGEERKYLLSYYLDMFRTTLFRQTQFAEFEYIAHNMAENDIPLTPDSLNNVYLELNKKYYPIADSDEYIKFEWARIPHFYRSFYVYKYATGLTSAVAIAKAILENKEGALDNYKQFLSLGGSKTPLEILKTAGVDLEDKNSFSIAMKEFEDVLTELLSL